MEKAVANLRVVKSESDFVMKCLEDCEVGDARLYNRLFKDRFIYDHVEGEWFEFKGHYWKMDKKQAALIAIDGVVDIYTKESKKHATAAVAARKQMNEDHAKKHDGIKKTLIKRKFSLQTLSRRRNVLSLSAAGRGMAGDGWDSKDMLLACGNGVIDLKTGKHRPGQPKDYLRRHTDIKWTGLGSPRPNWENALSLIFGGDMEQISYLKRVLGYVASGKGSENIVIFLYGNGGNGKTLFIEILNYVLGEYADSIEPELLLKSGRSDKSGAPNPAILDLQGRRLVFASETGADGCLDEERAKRFSGEDTLKARTLHSKHYISFQPTHTMFLVTNNRPQIKGTDNGIWRRVQCIPFNQTFVDNPSRPTEHKIDRQLKGKLKAEASGILAWIVEGCLEWQRVGLNPPKSVLSATEEYKAEQDVIGACIEECFFTGDGVKTGASDAYEVYRQWCGKSGIKDIGGVQFGKEMKLRFEIKKSGRKYYMGLGILSD